MKDLFSSTRNGHQTGVYGALDGFPTVGLGVWLLLMVLIGGVLAASREFRSLLVLLGLQVVAAALGVAVRRQDLGPWRGTRIGVWIAVALTLVVPIFVGNAL